LKFYGKRIFRNKMQQVVDSKKETRDAILWEVLPSTKMCRVKIQGSNEYIVAYYPENWEKTPFWLKPGNTVKIMHTGGVRGKIEIVGHGILVPTPVAGTQFPTVEEGEGTIISGCGLLACETPRMVVLVRTGIFRINGILYGLSAIPMSAGTNFKMSDGGFFNDIAAAVAINAAPATGNFRYDMFSVGVDTVIDYTVGTAAAIPVKPTPAAGHLLLGYVFIPWGTTVITQESNIGKEYSGPTPSSLNIAIADDDLTWTELSTTVTISVLDQFGNAINGTGYGWYLKLEIQSGNGSVSSDEEGSSMTEIGGHTGTGNSVVFTYTRDQLDPGDKSPTLWAKIMTGTQFGTGGFIILRNAAGEIML